MMGHPRLVPDSFEVPTRIEIPDGVLSFLTWRGFILDYEAYMSSVEHLQTTFNVDDPAIRNGLKWPEGTTIEQAFLDVAYVDIEHEARRSFSYVLLNHELTRQLGCLYVSPCKKVDFDVECRMWVRADELDNGLDERLYRWFRNWISEVWPFDEAKVAWPGREISWAQWAAYCGVP